MILSIFIIGCFLFAFLYWNEWDKNKKLKKDLEKLNKLKDHYFNRMKTWEKAYHKK